MRDLVSQALQQGTGTGGQDVGDDVEGCPPDSLEFGELAIGESFFEVSLKGSDGARRRLICPYAELIFTLQF